MRNPLQKLVILSLLLLPLALVTPVKAQTGDQIPAANSADDWSMEHASRREYREEMEQIRTEHEELESEHDQLKTQCMNAKGQDRTACHQKGQDLRQRRDALHERMKALHDKMMADKQHHVKNSKQNSAAPPTPAVPTAPAPAGQ